MSTVDIASDVEARFDGIRYAMCAVPARDDFWRSFARVKVRTGVLVPYFLFFKTRLRQTRRADKCQKKIIM